MAHHPTIRRAALSVAVLAATAACGSDSTGPKNGSNLSQAEATVVASSIFEEISVALSKSGGFVFDRSAPAPPVASFSAAPTTGTVQVNSTCTNGGTITGTYTFTEDIAANGSGTATGTFTSTTTGCKVSTGTRVIAVDGHLTYTFNMTFAQNVALDTFNWHATGNFSWSGGSCALDYTIAYTGAGTGHTTINGAICGVNISQTA